MAFDDVNTSDSQVKDTSLDRSTDGSAVSRGVWDDIAKNSTPSKSSDNTNSQSPPDSLDMGKHDIYASHDDFSPGKSATAVLEKSADGGTSTSSSDATAVKSPSDNGAGSTPADTAAGKSPTDNGAATTPADTAAGKSPTDNAPAATPTDTAAVKSPTDNGAGASPTDNQAGATGPKVTDTGAGATGPPATATDNQAGAAPPAATDNQAGAPPAQQSTPSFWEHPVDWTTNKAEKAEQWTQDKAHSAEQTVSDAWHKVKGDAPQDAAKQEQKPADSPPDKPTDKSTDTPADKPAENPALQKIDSNPDVQAQKEKLNKAIDGLSSDDEKAELRKNMDAFEQRAAKSNMQPSEVAGTYEQVSRLLEAPADKTLTHPEQRGLADSIMRQAADPSLIEQGQHETCTVAALENHMYTKNPAEASKMVADVALTGQYTTKGDPPVTVKMPVQDIKPAGDADISRSHASQIFQDTAVNIKYAQEGGNKEFIQTNPTPNGKPPHTGDEVVDNSTKPPKVVRQDKTGVSSTDIENINYQITGQHEKGLVIQNSRDTDGTGPGTTEVNNQQDLKNTLQQAKDSGNFPLLMRVHTGNEPFNTDSGGGAAGGSGGADGDWHIVSVKDYDPKTGNVQIENQWGPKANHPVPIADLYQSTKKPDDISELPIPGGAGVMTHEAGVAAAPKDTSATTTEAPKDTSGSATQAAKDGGGLLGGAPPEAPHATDTSKDAAAAAKAGIEGASGVANGAAEAVTGVAGAEVAATKPGEMQKDVQKPADNATDAAAKPGDDDASKKLCEQEKNKLEENLKSKLSDNNVMDKETHREIDQKIDKFEHRDPPVSAAERAKFYGELNHLMEAPETKLPKGKDGTDKDARVGLVDEMLENASKPKEIQQGQNQTCGAAAVESKLYTSNPSAAAHLVTEVALHGEYTPPGAANPVKVDASVLKPDSESKDALEGQTGTGRNYASQIFEGAAASLTDSGAGYHEGRPNHGGRPPGNHEWISQNGKEVPFKGLAPDDVQNLESKITGNPATPVVEKPSQYNEKDGKNTDGGYHVKDQADFQNHLSELKKQGKLPAVVFVDSGKEPFKSDSGGGKAGGSGGPHFVTVTDIDDNGNVAVSNQWGPEADHSDPNDHSKWIPSGRLYQATTG